MKTKLANSIEKLSYGGGKLLTTQEIAKDFGTSVTGRGFRKALAELVEEGVIKKINTLQNGRRRIFYQFLGIPEPAEKDIPCIIPEAFGGEEVRIVKDKEQYLIPLIDVCRGIGYNEKAGHKLIERNKELFSFCIRVVVTTTGPQKNETLCLTKEGVVGFLMKISYNRLKPEAKKRVLDFQRWAIEKLSTLISTGKVEISEKEQMEVIENLKEATKLEELEKAILDLEDENRNIRIERDIYKGRIEEAISMIVELKNKVYSLQSLH